MFNRRWLFSFVILTSFIYSYAQEDADTEKTVVTPQEFANQVEKYLREHRAATSEEIKGLREALAKVSADMEAQSNTIAGLQEKSKEFERIIAKLNMENAILKKENAKLAAGIQKEQNLRAAADLKLARALSAGDIVSEGDATESGEPVSVRKYTVKRGDVLSNIALAFKTTVDAIQRANNLDSTVIRPGQVLIIPGKEK